MCGRLVSTAVHAAFQLPTMPPLRPVALVLHATAAYIMYWGFSALGETLAGEWIRAQKGQHFQFLTIQG